MLPCIPVVHAVHHGLRLMNREHRPFREFVEIRIRHDRRDLDNRVGRGIEAGHFEIDPDQIARSIDEPVGVAHALPLLQPVVR